jgi:hypothetical protein
VAFTGLTNEEALRKKNGLERTRFGIDKCSTLRPTMQFSKGKCYVCGTLYFSEQ